MAARWAFVRGVRKLEFWNEPDLEARCVTYYSWAEHYTLQSKAIQDAFADSNADVQSGVLPCPDGAVCPLQPSIYASAFAQASFNGTSSASTPFSAASGYFAGSPGFFPDDYYAYLGELTVANEHTGFPPWAAQGGAGAVRNASSLIRPGLQNLNAFSIHSCAPAPCALRSRGCWSADISRDTAFHISALAVLRCLL